MVVRWCKSKYACLGCAVAFAVIMCYSSPALGNLVAVEIIPPDPTTNDAVRVAVHGYLSDTCWSLSGHTCGPVIGTAISVDVYTVDSWVPGMGCLLIVTDYRLDCDYGMLAAGTYQVTVTEHRSSLRNSIPDIIIFSFVVTEAPLPVERTTWGRIKALFI